MSLEVCLRITPKVLHDLADPRPGVEAFFDHHRQWCADRPVTVVSCTGNGDHVLGYAGRDSWSAAFDWARYNCFAGGPAWLGRAHNLNWLREVRDGGERLGDTYAAGPVFVLSEQDMDYHRLAALYATVRAVADERGIAVRLLEYLEPGPELCRSPWKTGRHPEVSVPATETGGRIVPGGIDVALPLSADDHRYAAFPDGIPADLPAGEFVAAQCGAFVADFGLDGVLLGEQFGLLGSGRPAGFLHGLRRALGGRSVYWAAGEAASRLPGPAYDAIDRVVVGPAQVDTDTGAAGKLLNLDLVDPWYWHRPYLDDPVGYRYQQRALARSVQRIDGVSFCANDTFGHFVPGEPLAEVLAAVTAGAVRHLAAGPR